MHSPDDHGGSHQAEGLVQLARRNPLRVIAVTSGKGGVGKTNVAVNLGVSLAKNGKNTLLLDADLGLANVDVLLGLTPAANLEHVIDGRAELADILLEGPAGLKVLPAASGVQRLADLDGMTLAGLIRSFDTLPQVPDALIIDTAAGIAEDVVRFCQAAHHVLVVVCDEPASVTDAYALIKVLSRDHGIRRFQVLANQVADVAEGRVLFDKLERVAERFLDADLFFAGHIPNDAMLRRAVREQRAVAESFPAAPASRAFKKLADAADKWSVPVGLRGGIEFFAARRAGRGAAA